MKSNKTINFSMFRAKENLFTPPLENQPQTTFDVEQDMHWSHGGLGIFRMKINFAIGGRGKVPLPVKSGTDQQIALNTYTMYMFEPLLAWPT